MADIVDDLQSAEDMIGTLQVELARIGDASTPADLLTPWCRPSCEDGECDDDCGCQAPHPDNPGHPS